MQISSNDWKKYIAKLRQINDTAAGKIAEYINTHGLANTKELIDYSYAIVRKYGEASAALSAKMYDTIAELSGVTVPDAEVADIAKYGDVAKAINGTLKTSENASEVAGSATRWVKMAGSDTTIKNGLRDRAEFAWIPSGDSCAFCLMLASNGWQPISKKSLKNGHAEHIHSNCDCQYMIRFTPTMNVAGYDPDKYKKELEKAEGNTYKEKINSIRNAQYQENKDATNIQKPSKAGEANRNTIINDFEKEHYKDKTESGVLIKSDGTTVEFDGIEHSVVGDASILDEMSGGTFTHNHPLDVTFSSPDIANGIVKGNLKELRAITSEGNIHILTNNASLEDRRKFNALYSEANKKFERLGNEKIRRGEITDKAAYIEQRKEKWLEENAPKYGLEYTKEKIN